MTEEEELLEAEIYWERKNHGIKPLLDAVANDTKCSVVDYRGDHCPEKPIRIIYQKDRQIFLCENCYEGYLHRKERNVI